MGRAEITEAMTAVGAYEVLKRATFAILRVNWKDTQLVGTGFVVSETPHVLMASPVLVGAKKWEARVRLGVTKGTYIPTERAGGKKRKDLQFLLADQVLFHPQGLEVALLRIDVASNREVASEWGLLPATPLPLGFGERQLGSKVAYFSIVDEERQRIIPRFFQGCVVASFVSDDPDVHIERQYKRLAKGLGGIWLIDIDPPTLPGCQGAAVLSLTDGKVIGLLRSDECRISGFTRQTVPIDNVEIGPPGISRLTRIKMSVPIVRSLGLAVDVRAIEELLRSAGVLENATGAAQRVKRDVNSPDSSQQGKK